MGPLSEIQWDNLVVAGHATYTLRELVARLAPRLDAVAVAGPVVLAGDEDLDLVACACWLADSGREGMVLPRERLTESVVGRLEAAGHGIVDVATGHVVRPGRGAGTRGGVLLLTSGTTGEPKLIQHTWTSLFTMARVRVVRPARWLMTYQSGTYAWYQLITALLFMPGQSLVLAEDATPAGMIAAAAAARVTALSATPTFWRLVLLQADPEGIARLRSSLESLTLGGEPVDQVILDGLRSLFPRARLVHIYASSEAGASIVVTDGRAGFPVAWLEDPRRTPQLRVAEGRLWIRSPHAAVGFGGWMDTQDLAAIREDRVHLLGRSDHAVINIGGAKALVADIERVLLGHPYVLWCRVRGVRAPLVGQLVKASVVPRAGQAGEPLPETALTAYCAERLPAHMVPRLWERLDRVPATVNWKTEV
jgi:acyl-coenzyme A synthetase/AMP-(fatty) acid ligase